MGVDVFAYRKLTFVPVAHHRRKFTLIVDPDFVERWPLLGQGLEAGRYHARDENTMELRIDQGIVYLFWREQLASLAGYTQAQALKFELKDAPFLELTSFGETQGLFGPMVSKKLYQDFVDFDDRASRVGGDFYALYAKMKTVFGFAQDGGLVRFS
jgi:hypothetical protein